jgi:hypothetical protein
MPATVKTGRSRLTMGQLRVQQPNGDAGPDLVRIYFAIDLVILLIGAVFWYRTFRLWRKAFPVVNSIIQTYFYLAIGDLGKCMGVPTAHGARDASAGG